MGKLAEFLGLSRFVEFCLRNAPKNDVTFTFFGLFSLVSTYSSMAIMAPEVRASYSDLIVFFTQTGVLISSIFLTYQIWPDNLKNKKFISVAWVLALTYMMSFMAVSKAIITNFDSVHLTMLILSLVVVSMVASWRLALSVIFIGSAIAMLGLNFYIDTEITEFEGLIETRVVYLLLLVTTILVAFARPRQIQQERSEATISYLGEKVSLTEEEVNKLQAIKEEFVRNINHEFHTPITGITSLGQSLKASYYQLSNEERIAAIDDIAKSSSRLEKLIANFANLSKLSTPKYILNKKSVDIYELTKSRVDLFKKLFKHELDSTVFKLDCDKRVKIECDEYYMSQVIDNLVSNAVSYGEGSEVDIYIEFLQSGIEFRISDKGIGIPDNELYDIFGIFNVSSFTKSKAGGRGVGLALCKKVVEMHGGEIWAENNPNGGATFVFILPF